jgi:hypothetical protein
MGVPSRHPSFGDEYGGFGSLHHASQPGGVLEILHRHFANPGCI